MDVRILCNVFKCDDECTEHAYCDAHYEDAIAEAREEGRKEGYEEARARFESIEG